MGGQEVFDQVLYIAPNYRWWKGGISSVIIEYKKSIKYFHFFPSTTSSNIVITAISFLPLLLLFAGKLLITPKLKVIHIHGASKGSFYRKYIFYLIAKKIFGRKVVYHIHGAGYHLFYQNASPIIKNRVSRMINGSDALVVLSEWWRDYFQSHFDPKLIEIIPNMVDEPTPVEKASQVNSKVNLLFLGRIGDRKGIFDLIDVIISNKNFFKEYCKLFVGGDGEVDKLNHLIDQYEIQDIVSYIGFIGGYQKAEIVANSDIYVLPSYNEGLPISILESMAYAKPIISTKVGGIPEVVIENRNGLLIEPGDKDALFKSIQKLVRSREERLRFGEESFKIVEANYFPNPVIEKLKGLYRKIL
ncbi:MAG: glycosyltransferase family 4 protein [Cyclobacteriaceae bacterium]